MSHPEDISPPKWANRILAWYCRPDRAEELQGDLEEFYRLRMIDGQPKWKADLFYWWNVIRCYKSYARTKTQNNSIMGSLIKSYLKLALRHSWKNRLAVGVNVAGLGLSLSLCVFVYMLYAYNLEFDTFHKDTDSIYRIHSITERNGEERRAEFSPVALDDKLRNEMAAIQQVSTYYAQQMTVKLDADYFEEYVGMVSPDFFEMFDIPLRYGSYKGMNQSPVVYLSSEAAKKYFGNRNPIGESFTLYFNNKKLEVTVEGIMEKMPLNSSFGSDDVMLSIDHYRRAMEVDINDWGSQNYVAYYVKLRAEARGQVEEDLNAYLPLQNEQNKNYSIKRMELIPFQSSLHSDQYLSGQYTNARLRPQIVIIFLILASLVFFNACFNLANTSMGLIAKRLKEIGVRKTLGSGSRQILIQFLFEVLVVTFLAFVVAVLSVNYVADGILGLFGVSFVVQDLNLVNVILFLAAFLLFTTLIAGLLPAFYAWRFQPAAIIRKTAKLRGVNWLNKTLTAAQFAFSIAVLAVGITFSQNSEFLREFDLGYEVAGIIHVPVKNEDIVKIKPQIDQIKGVSTATTAHHFGNFGRYGTRAELKIDTIIQDIRHYQVSDTYLEMMDIKLSQGKFFDGLNANSDFILVSQSFADTYFKGQEAINRSVVIDGERKIIIGVIKEIIDDVYMDSRFHPAIISLTTKEDFKHLVVKANQYELDEVNQQLKAIWSDNIDEPYPGELQSELALGQAGRDTRNLQKIFLAMAILSGLLSMVGIFSLAKINISKRLKEINIRKVLGASMKELLLTVNRPFVLVLLISLVIGCGLGYLIADAVLGMIYKYHIAVSISINLICGIFIVLLSLVLISLTALASLSASPVQGIREE